MVLKNKAEMKHGQTFMSSTAANVPMKNLQFLFSYELHLAKLCFSQELFETVWGVKFSLKIQIWDPFSSACMEVEVVTDRRAE